MHAGNHVYFTNRAAVYLKMEQFGLAMADCDELLDGTKVVMGSATMSDILVGFLPVLWYPPPSVGVVAETDAICQPAARQAKRSALGLRLFAGLAWCLRGRRPRRPACGRLRSSGRGS